MSGAAARRRAMAVLGVALLALLVSLPLWAGAFYQTLATRMLILALFATAYNVVFGMGGMHSLGHAAFFGVGGYGVGLGMTRWGWGFATIVVVGLVVAALLGLLFGLLTQRTEGIYLLLLTLALGQAVWALAFQQVAITRGDNGIVGLDRGIVPLVGSGAMGWYHFVLVVVVLVVALLWWFQRSPVGRAIVGTRESRVRMAALGYRVGWYRNVAFAVSGAGSAVAGLLWAWHHRFVSPEMLTWQTSAFVLVVAIVGGAAVFWGPALGAVAITALEFWVGLHTDRWLTVLGLIYVATILFLPTGVLGAGERWLQRRRHDDDDPEQPIPVAREGGA